MKSSILAALVVAFAVQAENIPAPNITNATPVIVTGSASTTSLDPWTFQRRHAASLDLIGRVVTESLGAEWDGTEVLSDLNKTMTRMLRDAEAIPIATNAAASKPAVIVGMADDPLAEVETSLRRSLAAITAARARAGIPKAAPTPAEVPAR